MRSNITDLKLVFWGTGGIAELFFLSHQAHLDQFEIIGFIDRDVTKQGNEFHGYRILSPDILKNTNAEVIVILSSFYKEIRNEIRENPAYDKFIIYSANEFDAECLHAYYGIRKHLTCPPELLELICENQTVGLEEMFYYMYLKEKYSDFILQQPRPSKENNISVTASKADLAQTNIWVCWLQGVENAPDIVKACINSIQKNAIGKVQIITEENFRDFVTLDNTILEKWKKKKITNTHFSDMLRLALLIKYGGIWIDATCLVLDEGLPKEIYQYPLFMYSLDRIMEKGYNDPGLYTSWFISVRERENFYLKCIYETLIKYWQENDFYSYFLIFYMQRLVMELVGEYIPEIPKIRRSPSYYFQENMNKKFDPFYWDMISRERPIQKLTYKQEWKTGDTFYDHILRLFL